MQPYELICKAVRSGVGVSLTRISREQSEQLKKVEREQGHEAATLALVKMLWPKA